MAEHKSRSDDADRVDVSAVKQFGEVARRALLLGTTLCVLAACTSNDSPTSDGSFTFTAPAETDQNTSDLPDSEIAAIVSLGHTAATVSAADQDILDTEINLAQSAMPDIDTIEEAQAAGYVLATAPSPGIGTHWVKWSQIRKPFAPDTPSMILFDQEQTPPVLVGYSYALQSSERPVGFTGETDEWHRHTGLCVTLKGWVVGERTPGPDKCDGSFIAGGDFWMLHAWVVPGWKNRDGLFAPMNPKLCPGDTGPDFLRCPDASNL